MASASGLTEVSQYSVIDQKMQSVIRALKRDMLPTMNSICLFSQIQVIPLNLLLAAQVTVFFTTTEEKHVDIYHRIVPNNTTATVSLHPMPHTVANNW